jgi:flagella basal body P-ring formation protein FlgA
MTDQVIVALLVLAASPAAAVEVRLRSSVVCPAPVVRLADVAEVRGGENPEFSDALSSVVLCPAPAPGSTQSLSQHQVRQLLTLSGVEASRLLVTGSEAVELLAETLPTPSRRAILPAGAIRQALFTVEEAENRRLSPTRPAAAPQPLKPKADPLTPRLVQRGATVSVTTRRPGIRVTTSGKALDPGAAGEMIHVELADSRERVLARVVSPHAVEVSGSSPTTHHSPLTSP